MIKDIPKSELKPNMIIGNDVYNNGLIIFAKGIRITNEMIEIIKKMDSISSIPVYTKSTSNISLKLKLSNKTPSQDITNLFNTIKEMHIKIKKTKNITYEDIKILKDIIINIINSANKNIYNIFQLLDTKKIDEYDNIHTTNIVLISIMLAIKLNIPLFKIVNIALSAALADIGKLLLPEELLLSPKRFTKIERAIIRQHVFKGVGLIKRVIKRKPDILNAILYHHERMDGSGYPSGLKGNEISEYACIIGLSDRFDAMISKRLYRDSMKTNEAIHFMIKTTDKDFSKRYITALINIFSLYPPGTTVELNTGEIATVKNIKEGNLIQPIVRILFDSNKRKLKQDYEIDLSLDKKRFIQNICK